MKLRATLLLLLTSASSLAETAPEARPAAPPVDTVTKARALEDWGDHAGAIRLLTARIESEPKDVAARTQYAKMLQNDGRDEDARTQLDAVVEGHPEHVEALRMLVHLELRTDHPERARELATLGLERDPENADLRVDRARALLVLGRLDEARADIEQVLSRGPGSREARELGRRIDAAAKIAAEAKGSNGDGSLESEIALFAAAVPMTFALAALENAKPAPPPRSVARGDLIEHARELARQNDRTSALTLLSWHLEATPTDSDARTLYATILAWEHRYAEAREQLERVLRDNPKNGDAARAALRVELWADSPKRAEELATQALEHDPAATDLLLDRARARFGQKELDLALADLDRVIALEPDNENAKELRARIATAKLVWAVGGAYTLDAFNDGRTPWHELMLEGKRSTSIGAVFVRAYEAWRWDSSDNQLELEAFPKIREGTYADVGAAFSPSADLYPHYRVQADLYQSFPLGFEASVGYRHLEFGSGVDMGVLSVGKYLGDWYFVARAFVTPGLAGTSISASGGVRYYLGDGNVYVGLRYGHGVSKEEIRSLNDIALLDSNTVGAEAAAVLYDRLELGARTSVSQQARAQQSDLFQYELVMTLDVRF